MAELSADERDRVMEELSYWAASHPAGGQPFLIVRGKTFTPKDFVKEVEKQSEFGRPFLDFLAEEARRYEQSPESFIQRAIKANQRL
jgi:hypothetical protein